MIHKVLIGWDPRETEAFEVAKFSIKSRCESARVAPLKLSDLEWLLQRPIEKRDGKMYCPISQAPMATEFAISRFCVPYLCKGWALFADCDIVCTVDISELFALSDPKYAVMCVQHQQQVKPGETKMDGQIQTAYNRKNWSSIVLFNCDHPSNQKLTRTALNTWPGRDLHAFKWLDDSEIGELPPEWNHLVGVSPGPMEQAKILHLTTGGPWFRDWKGGPADQIWLNEYQKSQQEARKSKCSVPEKEADLEAISGKNQPVEMS